jgi:hypothetical protein
MEINNWKIQARRLGILGFEAGPMGFLVCFVCVTI